MAKAKMAGTGWHGQSLRHSNARRFGRAGGTYSKTLTIQPTYVPRGSGNNPEGGKRDLHYKIKEWGFVFPTQKEAEEYASTHYATDGGVILQKEYGKTKWGEVSAHINLNSSITVSDGKDTMTYYGYSRDEAVKKFKRESNYKWQKATITTTLQPDKSIEHRNLSIDKIEATQNEKAVLKNLNYEYRPDYNMWSVGKGETKFTMTALGLSRKKADALIMKALNQLERETKR